MLNYVVELSLFMWYWGGLDCESTKDFIVNSGNKSTTQ